MCYIGVCEDMYRQEHMSLQRQGASNYVEQHLYLPAFSVRTMVNTLCGGVVVIAIASAHSLDDATDSLSL